MRLCPACGGAITRKIVVDLDSNRIHYNGQGAELTVAEAEIAFILARHSPNTVRHDHLRAAFFGAGEGARNEIRVIQAHISRLRRRLAPLGLSIKVSVHVGYFLEPHDGPVALARRRSIWTEEVRRKAVELCRQGLTRDEIGKRLNMTLVQVKNLHRFLVRTGRIAPGTLPPLEWDRRYSDFVPPVRTNGHVMETAL